MSAYVFISDLREHSELSEDFGRFTDIRPSRPSLALRQIVLVSFEGDALNALGRMKRGRKAANYKWHVTLDELVLLDQPLDLGELTAAVSNPVADALDMARIPPGGQIASPFADELLDAIVRIRPEHEDDLKHLRRISRLEQRRPPIGDREPIVEYERDAVGLALEMAGLSDERSAVLNAWDGRSDEPFLNSIPEYSVLEDRAIEHDARVFGGWKLIKSGMAGMTRFESRGRRVTIINVNRAGIEHAIGVDLIYYTQEYDAYVVVQFKRRSPADTDERWVFRPDRQFDVELDRMRALVLAEDRPTEPHAYRLDDRCCYLKFCAPTTPDAFSSDLVNGAYLPLAYWDVLEAAGALTGPRGGRVLSDRTVGRYLTNTLFIDLVRASWIGSRGVTSDLIEAVVAAGLESNHSLILAASTPTADPRAVAASSEDTTKRFDDDSKADDLPLG